MSRTRPLSRYIATRANVAELADAQDLGSCPVRGAGSTPAVRIAGALALGADLPERLEEPCAAPPRAAWDASNLSRCRAANPDSLPTSRCAILVWTPCRIAWSSFGALPGLTPREQRPRYPPEMQVSPDVLHSMSRLWPSNYVCRLHLSTMSGESDSDQPAAAGTLGHRHWRVPAAPSIEYCG
jgi:hypothetical protein